MRHVMAMISAAAVVVGGMVASNGAYASDAYYAKGDGNAANGEKIFREGKGSVPACASCHGEDGSGSDDLATPRLAGQFFSFLVKQLEDFASDKRKDTTMFVMNDNAKGLTTQDRRDVATYLSEKHIDFRGSDLEALKAAGTDVGEAYRGRAIVEYGSPRRDDGFPKELGSKGGGVPACKSCHGYAGRGAPNMYPMIGRQRYTYLVNQLKKWRDGAADPNGQNARTNDPMGQMRAVAARLSDDDILSAAAYLTGADPLTPGNDRAPYDHH
ncbi:MAG TPA: c-type cytochrome [Gammaproteobacteria bacterium]|nr:c-type cytochrome [Gammaproteobacteria bacterium]